MIRVEYRIEYTGKSGTEVILRSRWRKTKLLLSAIVLIAFAFLVSWDMENVLAAAEALEQMVLQLKQGIAPAVAVDVFREILQGSGAG